MRKHAVFAALAIVSALAVPHKVQAARNPSGIVTCDRQGCRAENQPAAVVRKASRARNALRRRRGSGPAPKAHQRASLPDPEPGVVRSKKTGATARVAARYAARFQAYVDDLEAHGAAVYYMGGFRRGRCSNASQHPCGSALDVCQDSRGHVSGARDCHLPPPRQMAAIAAAHGLEEGGIWCSSDYGHAQVHPSAGACPWRGYAVGSAGHGRKPPRRYLATITGKLKVVAR